MTLNFYTVVIALTQLMLPVKYTIWKKNKLPLKVVWVILFSYKQIKTSDFSKGLGP